MLDLSSHACVITGATGSLGHTVVRTFLEHGAHVAIPIRDATKEAELRGALGDLAGAADDARLIARVADLADRAQMDAFVEQVMRAWGRLDVLANLAGGFALGSGLDAEGIERLWQQNVRTTVTTTAACVRPMRARGYGRIVSVSSVTALKARKGVAGYAMAKGAIVRWTESLADELKGEGITVNCILPSTIDNAVNRTNRPKDDPKTWASAAEVAALILFLCSPEASGVTGAAIPVTART